MADPGKSFWVFFRRFSFVCLFPFWNTTGDPARLLGAGGPFHALAQSDAVGRRRRRPTDADAGDVTGGRAAAAAAAAAAAGAVDAQRRTGKGGNAHRRPRHPLLKVQTRKKMKEKRNRVEMKKNKQTKHARAKPTKTRSSIRTADSFLSVLAIFFSSSCASLFVGFLGFS